MNKLVPRYYQTDAKNAVFDFLVSGEQGNPLVCMPTATGKSLVIADTVFDIFRYFPGKRVMMLTHVWKLIEQNAAKLLEYWPTAPLGIHSEGLGRRDTMLPLIYGGVQSVAPTLEKNPLAFGRIDALIIDEAHLVGTDEDSQYLTVIAILKKLCPQLVVIGFTATWYRLKMGLLTDGGIFTKIVYNICTREWFQRLIHEGYLNPLIGKPTITKIEGIRDLKMIGGDFNQKAADALVNTDAIIEASCKEVLEYGYNRQKMMGFASGVKSAEHLAEMFDFLGASVTCVHSKISAAENKRRLKAFSAGEYWGVIGANMLTTGYDEPQIDLICDWQVTASPGKHVQKLGRGTRILIDWQRWRSDPKENTLVLDFVRNIGSLGPIDDPVMPRKPGQKTGDPPPIKICHGSKLKVNFDPELHLPEHPAYVSGCDAYNHASVRYCCNCANEFSFTSHVEHTAYNDSPMKQEAEAPKLETFEVNGPIWYSKHSGKDKGNGIISPPTVKVIYPYGIKGLAKYLCFEHTGLARHNAKEWWMKHSPNEPPATVDEFLARQNELRIPKTILVHTNTKFPDIMGYSF